MSGPKRYAPLVYAACLFVGTSAAALANPSQSVLDPYNYIPPPKASKGKGAAAPAPALRLPGAEQRSETYVSEPGSESEPKTIVSKTPKEPKEPKEPKAHKFGFLGKKEPKSEVAAAQQEATPKANQGKRVASSIADKTKSIGGGLADKTKGIGGGLADKTKGIGGGLADKTKSLGSGIASASKASGGYFVKGAKAIGGELKSTSEKVKDGTESVGSKIAHLGKSEDSSSAKTDKMVKPEKIASAKNAGKDPKKNPLYTGVNPEKVASGAKKEKIPGAPGLIGKTVSKLPFFGGHKANGSFDELQNPDPNKLQQLAEPSSNGRTQ